MKWQALAAAVLGTAGVLAGCSETPVPTVAVPRQDDASAYRPVPQPKPLPPNGTIVGGVPQMAPPPQPAGGSIMPPNGAPAAAAPGGYAPSIENEDAFVAAYARRSPRIMVFVNRTLQGESLPKDAMETILQKQEVQSSTGAVNVASSSNTTGGGQSSTVVFGGSSASNTNINTNQASSFTSGGPAEYSHTTYWKKPTDQRDAFGATADDYGMIESSLVEYFDNSGKVRVQDSDAAREKLSREQILRIENGDPKANELLKTELQTDVLIRVTATPTTQSANGPAIRLIAKAIGTTDARNLGNATVDMPMPMTKQNINVYTRYLASKLMGQMAQKWRLPPEYNPIEVRIYKAATIDDSLKISDWLKKTDGVASVRTTGATGGSTTSYAVLSVGFAGAPEDLYANLKSAIGLSTGLKAVDLQNNTINLEVTGPMNLVTTTRHVESTTTVETHTTDEQRIEPINPAPQPVAPQPIAPQPVMPQQ